MAQLLGDVLVRKRLGPGLGPQELLHWLRQILAQLVEPSMRQAGVEGSGRAERRKPKIYANYKLYSSSLLEQAALDRPLHLLRGGHQVLGVFGHVGQLRLRLVQFPLQSSGVGPALIIK